MLNSLGYLNLSATEFLAQGRSSVPGQYGHQKNKLMKVGTSKP